MFLRPYRVRIDEIECNRLQGTVDNTVVVVLFEVEDVDGVETEVCQGYHGNVVIGCQPNDSAKIRR